MSEPRVDVDGYALWCVVCDKAVRKSDSLGFRTDLNRGIVVGRRVWHLRAKDCKP